jgi:hypothetical protein
MYLRIVSHKPSNFQPHLSHCFVPRLISKYSRSETIIWLPLNTAEERSYQTFQLIMWLSSSLSSIKTKISETCALLRMSSQPYHHLSLHRFLPLQEFLVKQRDLRVIGLQLSCNSNSMQLLKFHKLIRNSTQSARDKGSNSSLQSLLSLVWCL